ncbi:MULTISPECIES: SDR family NAD(P)-dependent oxidoreductase, partial [unclassified Bradyrhizobium]|uniref:SDR family NAD(P)-dependent oxidoreductase n=1 Tax=unclassified Bradyrhizobium TaxID=2631580 RepID=UPI002916D688
MLQVLGELRSVLEEKPQGPVLLQALVPCSGDGSLLAGLSGLLRTAHLENPNLVGQVIHVEEGDSPTSVAAKLQESATAPQDGQVRYWRGVREVLEWDEVEVPSVAASPWRDGGVYLITGGAGGLGLLFAAEIVRCAKGARVVLTGRSALSAEKQLALAALGEGVEYRQVNVSDGAAVAALVADMTARFGSIQGILHGAGVIEDTFMVKKTAVSAQRVLSPKVAGVVNVDAATQDMALEFMIFFASASGALGNVGQGDYAAANGFLDGYARYRNELASAGLRRGRTLSIDWPLWRDGGMRVDASVLHMQHSQGVTPLETRRGIQALNEALAADADQVLVLSGDLKRLR